MLKTAMYLNVFLILGLSIAALVLTFRKKSDLKKIALLTMVFTTLNFYSFCLLGMEIVDTEWDIIVLGPVSLVTLIINIVTTIFNRYGTAASPVRNHSDSFAGIATKGEQKSVQFFIIGFDCFDDIFYTFYCFFQIHTDDNSFLLE